VDIKGVWKVKCVPRQEGFSLVHRAQKMVASKGVGNSLSAKEVV
jgi:hypothetical protein